MRTTIRRSEVTTYRANAISHASEPRVRGYVLGRLGRIVPALFLFLSLGRAQNQTPPNPGLNVPFDLSTNLPCQWTLDDISQGTLAPGTTLHLRLELGRHRIQAKSDDGLDQWDEEFEIQGTDGLDWLIDLAAIRAIRLDVPNLPSIMQLIAKNVAAWKGGTGIDGEHPIQQKVEVSHVTADDRGCRLSWHTRASHSKPQENDHLLELKTLGGVSVTDRRGGEVLATRQMFGRPTPFNGRQQGSIMLTDNHTFSPRFITVVEGTYFTIRIFSDVPGLALLFHDEQTAEQTLTALERAVNICASAK
jgi:hypothetical protein